MRVLFATGTPAAYMSPPILGDEQVNCGPDWPNEQDANGRVRSLKTPAGKYDLGAIAAQLPSEQQPDVVVTLVDASWRNVPHNLAAFKCPRVLLIADTHHLRSPLIGMLRYMSSEPYHRAALLYDRHHAMFFHAAGFRDLAWLPGLTFPHGDAVVQAARRQQRERRVAFVGQTGNIHARRARLLSALNARKLPVFAQPLTQSAALKLYGSSAVGFNASLNGDLNLRVFEILASGAALLTDQLAAESGLAALLSGAGIKIYSNENELADLAAELIASPEQARALGEAGASWFDAHFNESQRREMFRAFAFDGVTPERFAFEPHARERVFFGGDTDRLLQSAMVYEGVQELHRTQETVRVQIVDAAATDFASMCETLPRVQLESGANIRGADLMVVGRNQIRQGFDATRLWCWDADVEEFAALAAQLAPDRFALASRDVAVFCRDAATPVSSSEEQLPAARKHFQQGNHKAAFEGARAVLTREPRSVEARILLAEITLRRADGVATAEKLLRQVLQLSPANLDAEALLGEAAVVAGKLGPAVEQLERVVTRAPKHLHALTVLARAYEAAGDNQAAEARLREAQRHHPLSPAAARALGDFLKRSTRLVEALEWHRRSVGAADDARFDAAVSQELPLRILFVVQQPQGWSSLESAWRALSADPRASVTLVAVPYQHPYPPEGGPDAIYDFLTRQGLRFIRGDEFRLEPGCGDVVFLQNPYDVTRPAPWRTEALLKVIPRLAYIPYGIEIGGGAVNATHQHNMSLHQLAWIIFGRSERHKAMFAKHCATGSSHVIVTGHPKMDPVKQLALAAPDPELAAFAHGRPIVFWNPQFDVKPDGTGYSTFLKWETFLLAEFARRPGLAFVIRPHPLFFGTLEARGIWSAEQIADFHRRVAAAGNIQLDRRASYLPIFGASAAMLSDASSFLLEYAGTGKPLLYLHNEKGPQLNDDGEYVRGFCDTALVASDITTFLDRVARGEDARGEARRAAYGAVMHLPESGAGEAIRAAVFARLNADRAEFSAAQLRMGAAARTLWRDCARRTSSATTAPVETTDPELVCSNR